jgi:NAD(P)-dependent dehydrogenase (short-subunit alcohol dehydrogenase family)
MARGHKDKVAVITGGSKGIGQAFAKRLAEDGVHVAIADVASGAETVKMIEAAGRRALACACDVTAPDQIAALAAEVQKKFGRCDILINCAGIYPQRAFDDMTFEEWRRVLSINLDSCFLFSKQFVPGMKQRGWGRIVNLASSTLGSVVTGFAHYVASKGGIVGFTRAAATDLAPYGITVNAIAPSMTLTERIRPRWNQSSPEDQQAEIERTPLRRVAEAPDQAKVICFLASSDADFVTGVTIDVTGGN